MRNSFLNILTGYSLPSVSNIASSPRCVVLVCVLLMAKALPLGGLWNFHRTGKVSFAAPIDNKEAAHG